MSSFESVTPREKYGLPGFVTWTSRPSIESTAAASFLLPGIETRVEVIRGWRCAWSTSSLPGRSTSAGGIGAGARRGLPRDRSIQADADPLTSRASLVHHDTFRTAL